MKKLIILTFVPLFVLSGCGGGAGGSNDAFDKWLGRVILFAQTEDMTGLRSTISDAYVNNCENKTTTTEAWEVTFANSTTITITNVNIHSKVVNEDTASASGSYVIRSQGPSGTTERTVNGPFILRKEPGGWKEFGNQTCF